MASFRLIRQHWRSFLGLILVITAAYIVLVGLMDEAYYEQYQDSIASTEEQLGSGDIGNFARAALLLISTFSTAGLTSDPGEAGTIFLVLLFLITWLVTVFLVRHFLKGSRPRLRDAFYNALTPLISTLVVLAVAFIQAIPILLVIITYETAVATDFLATPFYALVYFLCALLLLLLSVYLLAGSLMALAAVTAPGVYPFTALAAASDLISGRRTRVVLRLLFLIPVLAVIYIVCLLPVILIDLWAKAAFDWLEGVPVVPFWLLLTTCFVFVYVTVYLYRYYKYLLESDGAAGPAAGLPETAAEKEQGGDSAPDTGNGENHSQESNMSGRAGTKQKTPTAQTEPSSKPRRKSAKKSPLRRARPARQPRH